MIDWDTELVHLIDKPTGMRFINKTVKGLFTLAKTSNQNINDCGVYMSLMFYLKDFGIECELLTELRYIGKSHIPTSRHYIYVPNKDEAALLKEMIVGKIISRSPLQIYNN